VYKRQVLCSTKYDGVRCLVFVIKGGVTVTLRSGKNIYLNSLERAMRGQPEGVYDGELVHGDGEQAGRTRISGQVNKVLKGTADEIENYTFCIFDYVSLHEWRTKISAKSYAIRYNYLLKHLRESEHVTVASQTLLYSPEEVNAAFQRRLDEGYEGIMLRYPEDTYEWKRTPKLIKKKAIKECVLECVDEQLGTGKYAGMIGALICKGIVDTKEVEVKVGSGLSDHDREGRYIGKRIEIEYNDIVKAKNSDTSSLFLPRFKRVQGEI